MKPSHLPVPSGVEENPRETQVRLRELRDAVQSELNRIFVRLKELESRIGKLSGG